MFDRKACTNFVTKIRANTVNLGCCINSFHFLWAILSTSTVCEPVIPCCFESHYPYSSICEPAAPCRRPKGLLHFHAPYSVSFMRTRRNHLASLATPPTINAVNILLHSACAICKCYVLSVIQALSDRVKVLGN